MDKILHKSIPVNGLNLHVADVGSKYSPAVVFLHGFPGTWYTWRHQMVAVANADYRAIAPDFRGYGLSVIPPEPEKASFADFIDDIASILDSLAISREPGRAESDFGRCDAKTVVRNLYILFSKNEIPIGRENEEIMDLVKPSTPLPSWFTEEDLATYGALFEKSGFQTALQVPYRSVDENIESPEHDPLIEAPAMLIIGEEDFVIKYPGLDKYVRSGEVKKYVPNLKTIYVPHGSHFVNEQFPDKINQLIITFLDQNKHHLVV